MGRDIYDMCNIYAIEKLENAVEMYLKNSNHNIQDLDYILWNTMLLFQGHSFYTAKGLLFTYSIKGNELFTTRKRKSITKSTIITAFHKALELERMVSGPKKLGTFGASYLYSIFIEFKIIKT